MNFFYSFYQIESAGMIPSCHKEELLSGEGTLVEVLDKGDIEYFPINIHLVSLSDIIVRNLIFSNLATLSHLHGFAVCKQEREREREKLRNRERESKRSFYFLFSQKVTHDKSKLLKRRFHQMLSLKGRKSAIEVFILTG